MLVRGRPTSTHFLGLHGLMRKGIVRKDTDIISNLLCLPISIKSLYCNPTLRKCNNKFSGTDTRLAFLQRVLYVLQPVAHD